MSLRRDFQALPSEMRLSATAAVALVVSLILPWYQKSYFEGQRVVQANVSALGVFTFVEAAVLLVAVAVLFLVWARSQRKGFHLPGGDGVAITMAGGWALLLLVWRLFDKPDIKGIGVTVGIQWGIFGALLAAGALVVAGARVRAAHRPEPPNPVAEEDEDWVAPARTPREPRPDRRPRDRTAFTDALSDRPAWEGEPGEPPARARRRDETTRRLPDDDAETRRSRDDDPATRPFRDDDPKTRPFRDDPEMRRRDDEATTRRLPDDEEAPRRSRDDDPETRRYRDDDPETRRLPPEATGRLWDDPEES